MNILLIGSGGREHALAWKIAASPLLTKLWCAPGNAGIAREAECVELDIANHAAVIEFCKSNAVDLVVVGPETPLAAGIVDDLAAAARLSRAHFSREFRRAFGETPHAYLLSRRLERAAALLRGTDYSVADICVQVGLTSVGSFTSSFGRAYGLTPTQYRDSFPSAASLARIPLCVLKAYGRPANSTIGEDTG